MSSVLAIDFGNENIVMAAPRKGGVDVILNQASHRLSPSMIAYSETRRYAGEHARTQQMQNVKGTITQLKRLIGLKFNTPEREKIQNLIPYELVELEDGFIGVKVMYLEQEKIFRVEQCVAYLIKDNFEIARLQNIHATDCVIIGSPFWDECQRRTVLDAAKIAGVNVLKLLNSTTAAAIGYSMYHRKRLPEKVDKAVPVAFVDFGDSSINCAIVMLSQGSVEVKGFACNEHLGGQDFTTALVNMLLQKTQEKYKIDPTTNARAMLRFTQAAEKLKKSLSINPVMPFDVQSCLNTDINFMVKREEYEETIKGLLDQIEEPITRALELANVKKEDLFAIEVHGGASRTKAVKDKIRDIFGKELTQSLNPDECFALGGGFQAAILSPQYKVDLKVKDVAPHQIMIEWTDEEGNLKTNELFKQFNDVPCTKLVPIKVKRTCHVRLFHERSGELATVDIDTNQDEPLLVKLKVRLTPDGILNVLEAFYQVTEEVIIQEPKKKEEPKKEEPVKDEEAITREASEEQIPKTSSAEDVVPPSGSEEQLPPPEGAAEEKKEEPAPAPEPKKEEEKPPEPKKKKVTTNYNVNFIFKPHYGLSQQQIDEFKREENKMAQHDKDEIAIDEAKNELESYIFKMDKYINYDYPEYFDPAKKDEYLGIVSKVQLWWEENEFDRLPLKDYQEQLSKLKAFGEPANARRELRFTIPQQIAEYVSKAEKEAKRLDTKEEKFDHITQEERNAVKKQIDDFIQWLKNKETEVENTPKHLDLPFRKPEVETKLRNVESKVNELFCKPRPKPKPKEEKKDEKKEGEKPAEEKKEEQPAPEAEKKPEETQ